MINIWFERAWARWKKRKEQMIHIVVTKWKILTPSNGLTLEVVTSPWIGSPTPWCELQKRCLLKPLDKLSVIAFKPGAYSPGPAACEICLHLQNEWLKVKGI